MAPENTITSRVNKPRLVELSSIGSPGIGFITVAEKATAPFEIKRVYWTYYTPNNVVRGNHAHIELEQILIAVNGSIKFELEDHLGEKFEFILDRPSLGLY